MEIYDVANKFYKQLIAIIEAGYNPSDKGHTGTCILSYENYKTGETGSVATSARHSQIGILILQSILEENNDLNFARTRWIQ